MDDGSTDGSGERCDSYAVDRDNLTVVHQQNSGPLLARQAALSHARGLYAVTLDADDMLRPDALEVLSCAIDESGADIVGFNYSRTLDYRTHARSRLTIDPGFYGADRYHEFQLEICSGRHNNVWGKCIKRSLASMDAECAEYRGIKYAEDLLQLLSVTEAASTFFYLDEALYYYRPNPQSSTGTYRRKHLEDLSVVIESLLSHAARWGTDCLDEARRGALLQVSHLIHILVSDGAPLGWKVDELGVIRGYTERAGLLGPWQKAMRFDKRLEFGLLGRGRLRALYGAARAMLAVDHMLSRSDAGEGAR